MEDPDLKGFDIDLYTHPAIEVPTNEQEYAELMEINRQWVEELRFLDGQIARVNIIIPPSPAGLRDKMRREWKMEKLKRKKEHRAMVEALKKYKPNAMMEAW